MVTEVNVILSVIISVVILDVFDDCFGWRIGCTFRIVCGSEGGRQWWGGIESRFLGFADGVTTGRGLSAGGWFAGWGAGVLGLHGLSS